jgi:hypothetical protein
MSALKGQQQFKTRLPASAVVGWWCSSRKIPVLALLLLLLLLLGMIIIEGGALLPIVGLLSHPFPVNLWI